MDVQKIKGIGMNVVKVTFEDGDSMVTRINGSREEVAKYYMGNTFNMGVVSDDMKKVVKVEFLED